MTLTGTITKQTNPAGQPYYQFQAGESAFAISMTESRSQADDAKVLEPLVGKTIEVEGIVQKSRGTLMAFSVRTIE